MIQLREKDLTGKELLTLARELRELTRQYGSKLLINDRIDIALAVDADGVHLGHQSISVQDARRAFESSSMIGTVPILRQDEPLSVNRDSPLIGVSTHLLEEALQAESDSADFITVGPVYYTPSKAAYGEPLGIENLKKAAKEIKIPIFALGGIKRENVGEVLNTGAYGVSMISAIMSADDVKKETEEILREIAEHRTDETQLM